MSGGSIETQIDGATRNSPETQAAAARYIERTQDEPTELLLALGLAVEVEPEPTAYKVDGKGRMRCTTCGRPTRADGICRVRKCGGAR